MIYILFYSFSFILLLLILGLFARKAGLQLQYLRIRRSQHPGKISDFWKFGWSDSQMRRLRWEAFLLFPMLYGVPMDEDNERLIQIKRKIKRTHILIYLAVIVLIVLGIFSDRILS